MKNGVNNYSFLLGFLGFLGFRGVNDDPLYFLCFAFFAYFSHLWWFKLDKVKDKHLTFNRHKAGSISFKVCFIVAILLSIIIRLFSLDLISIYKIQLLIIAFTFALSTNLWAFLTYKFELVN